jgi:hypothetical protein
VGSVVDAVVGAAVAGAAVVGPGVVTGAVVAEGTVEPAVVEGIEMIEVVMTPDANGPESPLSPAHADATKSVAMTSARLTGRS